MKTLHQVKLRRVYEGVESFIVCYIPIKPVHRKGDMVTLKDSENPDYWWEIIWISEETLQASDINRGWDNNI